MGHLKDISEFPEIGETTDKLHSGHRLGELSIANSKIVSTMHHHLT